MTSAADGSPRVPVRRTGDGVKARRPQWHVRKGSCVGPLAVRATPAVIAGAVALVFWLPMASVTPAESLDPKPASQVSIVVTWGEVQSTFVRVPPGTFMMGESDSKPVGGLLGALLSDTLAAGSHVPNDARPVRQTTITRTLFVHATKVTAAQYCEFLNRQEEPSGYIDLNKWAVVERTDGGYRPKAGMADAAVNTVPWTGAVKYCEWLSSDTGLSVRLPTEAEWEWIARGPAGRKFPWGDVFETNSKYSLEVGVSAYAQGRCPDNATPQGVMDMIGSIAEWCADYYTAEYAPQDRLDPAGPRSGTSRVMRAREVKATHRYQAHPGGPPLYGGLFGFRPVIECPSRDAGLPTNQDGRARGE